MGIDGDTILAPITAPGHAGVSVVRISGPRTREMLCALTPRGEAIIAEPRTLVFTHIYSTVGPLRTEPSSENATSRPLLDQGMVVFFPGPGSFTGEDCAEFHLHGSPFLVRALCSVLAAAGLRQARPGEFTERAFFNGKIDLCQAEAVNDLIAAETELQARCAREQLAGRLSEAISEIGEPLRNFLAEIEAYIDFPDEDIEPLTLDRWQEVLGEVETTLDRYLSTYRAGRLCRDGALVVLAGLPNAGKSSLLNALLEEDRAIVTDIPGTTRDSIEERISLDGLPLRLCDTAGLLTEEAARAPDLVEQLGIARSWEKLTQADLVLYLSGAAGDGTPLGPEERPLYERVRGRAAKTAVIISKRDLLTEAEATEIRERVSRECGIEPVFVTTRDRASVSRFREWLSETLLGEEVRSGSLLITTQRHADALREAHGAVREGIRAIQDLIPPEFVAVHVRAALGALHEIIGVTQTEDILGRIFSKFCIGK